MPELPEVETIVRGLQRPLVNRTFTGVTVLWPNAVKTPLLELKSRLPGQRIESLTRRGKYLQFSLSGGDTLFLHLKMSGELLVEPNDEPLHPHVRTIFDLDNQHQLRFKDTRKFGRVYLVDDPAQVTAQLGPEPLADDFTVEDFIALFAGRRGRLKPLLLNQHFLAGVGNIYGDESCFVARIHPRRQVDTLSEAELTPFGKCSTTALSTRGPAWTKSIKGGNSRTISRFTAGRASRVCAVVPPSNGWCWGGVQPIFVLVASNKLSIP
jgi:formamidopyrimidine-DNA glycosylase